MLLTFVLSCFWELCERHRLSAGGVPWPLIPSLKGHLSWASSTFDDGELYLGRDLSWLRQRDTSVPLVCPSIVDPMCRVTRAGKSLR